MSGPLVFRWEFDIRVPREDLWRFVADTERVNRLAGLFRVAYEYEPLPEGGSRIRAEAKSKGVRLRWIERPCVWREPERFAFTRDYEGGPFRQLRSTVELFAESDPGRTRLVHTIAVEPRGLIGRLLARVAIGVEARKGFERAYALAEEWFRGEALPAVGSERPRSPETTIPRWQRELAEVGNEIGRPELADRLRRHLLEGCDSDLGALRPYRLADRWREDRRDTLRLLLHATKSGLLDMRWSLICPSCRRSRTSFPRLRDLTATGHCDSCNIRFDVHFDRSVEVTFSPAPLGLGTRAAEYCHAGPMNTPHWAANEVLAPGERRVVQVNAWRGKYQLQSPQSKGAVFCEFLNDPALPASARVRITPDEIAGVPPEMRAGGGALDVSWEGTVDLELRLARTEWADDTATAAEVTALREFRDLFGSEILAPGASFSIQTMVFLFSDLVGSTSMYEAIGDAQAFALVRSHFDLLQEICSRHNGTLIKTIGDAVMAAFRTSREALLAAVEMQERIAVLRDARTGSPLQLRIGLHRGPCIAMEANNQIDYFGSTVNLAARVQKVAEAFEVAFTEAAAEPDLLEKFVGEKGYGLQVISCTLRGITREVQVHRLRVETGGK